MTPRCLETAKPSNSSGEVRNGGQLVFAVGCQVLPILAGQTRRPEWDHPLGIEAPELVYSESGPWFPTLTD